MHYDFEKVTQGYRELFDDFAKDYIINYAFPTNHSDDPDKENLITFDRSGIAHALKNVREYAIDNTFDLTKTGFLITPDGYTIPPENLKRCIYGLYSFWHKCSLYTEESPRLTKNQIYASLFVLALQSRFRIDFGLNLNLHKSNSNQYHFTYSDIHNLSGSNRGNLRNISAGLELTEVDLPPRHLFNQQNPFAEYSELESFYINYGRDTAHNKIINHWDAQYFLSRLRGYKPTSFQYYKDGINILPDLSHPKPICDTIKRLLNPKTVMEVERFADSVGLSRQMMRELKNGKKFKLSLSILVRIDWALFKSRFRNETYRPFEIIHQ